MEAVVHINNRVGISMQWLLDHGVATVGILQKREQRGKLVALTRGGRGVQKVYEYKTMPEDMKRMIDERLDVYQGVCRNILEPCIEHSAEISQYFDEYKTAKGAHLPNSKEAPVRQTYYYNAIVLEGIIRLLADGKQKGQKISWSQVLDALCGLDRLAYPFSLPENERKLKDRVKEYQREGLECLIHKNYRRVGSGSTKVHAGLQSDMLISMIAEHRNFDCEEIAKVYNEWVRMQKAQGADHAEQWKEITGSTVRLWQKKSKFITTASKHGGAAYRNSLAYTVQRSAPTKAMYMWVLDGWDAELLYQKKDGKGRTTYHNRVTLEVVLDAATKYPIGYAIGITESAELIREALRNAERHVEELTGTMLRPHQIQCDNFAKKAMSETYEGLATLAVTPAAVGNAKAKVIEPWFRHFNDKVCKYAFNWSGHGVTAKKNGQPNLDITLKDKSQLPTLEELVTEISALMWRYRQEALPAYVEAINALPAGERVALPVKQYLQLFGEQREDKYSLQTTGINLRVLGERHQYDLLADPDDAVAMAEAIRFRENCWEKWNVKCDPFDYSHILVFNDKATEEYVLTVKDVQPMALKDRKPGDYEKLAAVWKFNKALEAHIANTLGGHQERAMAALESTDRREYEMLSKALITDSHGQHKDNKYRAERALPAAPVNAFEVVTEYTEDRY